MFDTSTTSDTRRLPRRTRAELERGGDFSRAVPALLRAARRIAGDDELLWVEPDGSVAVLNHPRAQRCRSAACPACPSTLRIRRGSSKRTRA